MRFSPLFRAVTTAIKKAPKKPQPYTILYDSATTANMAKPKAVELGYVSPATFSLSGARNIILFWLFTPIFFFVMFGDRIQMAKEKFSEARSHDH